MSAIYEVLRQLDEWRHLPAYQLERRVDIFFGMFLPKVIEKKFAVHVDELIPEFPLHKGELELSKECKDNRSINVDFAVFGSSGVTKKIFLIELKTDNHSLDPKQLENMEKVKCAVRLLCGVKRAAQASRSKSKYEHLIFRLLKIGCLRSDSGGIKSLKCGSGQPRLAALFEGLCVSQEWREAKVVLVVVHPTEPKRRAEGKVPEEFETITLGQFADFLEEGYRPFRHEFVKIFADHLRTWDTEEAGSVNPCAR